MFGVLPNFKTVNDPNQPVTSIGPSEKFQLVLHYFDPFTFAITSIQAGIEQDTNAKASYGQGTLGYAKRFGADFTDAFTNELFVVGVYPSLLHEDPRYFRLGHGSGWHRTGYALSRILIARTDSGRASLQLLGVSGQLHFRLDFAALLSAKRARDWWRADADDGADRVRLAVQYPQGVLPGFEAEAAPEERLRRHRLPDGRGSVTPLSEPRA